MFKQQDPALAAHTRRVRRIDRELRRSYASKLRAPGGIGSLSGRIAMSMSIDYDVPVETLFPSITEPPLSGPLFHPVRVVHLCDADDPADRFGAGALRAFRVAPGVRYVERVVAKEPLRRFEWTFVSGAPLEGHRGVLTFEALAPDRSRMTQDLHFDVSPGCAAPLVARLVWRANMEAFLRAKLLLESDVELAGLGELWEDRA